MVHLVCVCTGAACVAGCVRDGGLFLLFSRVRNTDPNYSCNLTWVHGCEELRGAWMLLLECVHPRPKEPVQLVQYRAVRKPAACPQPPMMTGCPRKGAKRSKRSKRSKRAAFAAA